MFAYHDNLDLTNLSIVYHFLLEGMEVGNELSIVCPPWSLFGGAQGSKDPVRTSVFLKGIGKPPPRGQDVAMEVQKHVQRLIDSAVDDRQFGNANMKEGKLKDAKQVNIYPFSFILIRSLVPIFGPYMERGHCICHA